MSLDTEMSYQQTYEHPPHSNAADDNLDLRSILQQQALQMAELQRRLAEMSTPTFTVPPTPAPHEKPPREKLPILDKYAGDLALYLAWKSKANAKLDIDGQAIGSLSNQAWYIHSRLDGDALAKFQPWMSHCPDNQRTPELVFRQLDALFLDPTLQAKALDWLNETRQKDTPLATYLPEFDRKLLEAGGQNWDDVIKINMLFKNLNFQLHNRSVGRPRPSTYSEYCADLRLLDNDLSQFRAFQNRKGFRRTNAYVPNRSATTPASEPEPMDWIPHVNAGRPRVPNVSGKDAADRIARGVCIRCDKPGHFANQCPNAVLPSRSPARVNAVSSADKQEQGKEELSP
ncbi:hypothetical protein I7I50_06199 [Histoplasma capsulatum G186AR]|uniref:CCHC-type domain-containing protein n=1 Tax=Ajellomyces capsulatus TaxID=5037 RepID=A0A8H7YWS9_AJECA|nr:hypothetical protein I7I52_08717 [Histoplasma capsulatum]QSS67191.1 hypothetical protein I7I50_06199 [Histoplasma capsulatum G186AR]